MSELLIGLMISSLMVGGVSTLAIWGANEFRRVNAQMNANRSAMAIETALRTYIGQAMNVREVPLPDAGYDLTGNFYRGQFTADMNYDRLSAWTVDPKPIGLFLREEGSMRPGESAANLFTDAVPTGIFLKRPTPRSAANPNGLAGVLFIDIGARDSTAADPLTSNNIIEPDYGDLFFPGITEFRLTRQRADRNVIGTTTGAEFALSAVRVGFNLRFYLSQGLGQSWCPEWDRANGTAGCDTPQTFFEIERDVRVVLHNNDLTPPFTGPTARPWIRERPLGYVHFFKPIYPDAWSNL